MDKALSELLNNVSASDVLAALILLSVIGGICYKQKENFMKRLETWRNKRNKDEQFRQTVCRLEKWAGDFEGKLDQYEKNRTHDRNDSIRIRDDIYDALDKQNKGIENLTKIINDMQEKNSKTKRAEIKEKIERIYSECHPAMMCTDMQFETLKELIEEYEAHGGINSFVHTTVQPEMFTWKKIKRIKDISHE